MPWEHDNDADIRRTVYRPRLMAYVLAALIWALAVCVAFAQQPLSPPSGQPVINQALAARLLTPSDTTVLMTTRGIYIGDATACNVVFKFAQDSSAVTFNNLQPGQVYPFSVVQVQSTNTTCASIYALY